MSITAIGNINEVCNASVNPQRAEEACFFDGNPRLGMVIYSNRNKTTRKSAGNYALKFQGKTYKISTDAQGVVSVFDGQCSAAILPKRLITYMHSNNYDVNNNLAKLKEQTNEMVAAGANCLCLTINFDYTFTSYAQLQANSEASWAKYDEWFQHAASKNLPVGLRINLGMDDNYIPQFWGFENAGRDEWGYEYRVFYGNSIPCWASSTARNMTIEFFQKVINRYLPLFGNNLIFIQPTTASTQEFGGEWRNRQYPDPEYFIFGDYNSQNIVAFRNWLKIKYNNNIGQLKAAWGSSSTSYLNFDDVQPPHSGVNTRYQSTCESLRYMLQGKKGTDWYLFHQKTYRDLFVDLTTIVKAANSNIQMSALFGTCSDEISLSGFAYNVKEWCRIADNIQTLYSTRDFRDWFDNLSVDWVRSLANKPIFTEVADFDAGNPSAAKNYAKKSLDNGASYVAIIGDKTDSVRWQGFLTLMRELVDEYATKPVIMPASVDSIETTMTEVIQNWPAVTQKWKDKQGSSTKRIQINFTEDV